jgi:Flp pilus assembly protein TadD
MANEERGLGPSRLNAEAGELTEEERYEEAISLLEKALCLDPGNPLILYNLALALKASGKSGRAENILAGIAELAPEGKASDSLRSAALTLLGLIQYESGNKPEAERLYVKAIGLDNENPDPRNDLGVIMFVSERYAEAKALFEEAARLAPTSEDILINLRDVHYELARIAEASEAGKKEIG